MLWIKPQGYEFESNDRKETIEYLESLGFKRKGEKSKPKVEGNTDKQDKNALEKYAKEAFGVDLDKRKSLSKLQEEVAELEK